MAQTDVAPDHSSAPGTPRWVKVLGIIALILVLVFITLHLSGRSPMDHNSNMSNMNIPPTQLGVQQP